MKKEIQRVLTHLCFNDQAEAAVKFYVSVFKDARILHTTYCGEGEYAPAGSVRTVMFELFGQKFWAVNGGPHFKFTDGISLYVVCDTQEEIDRLWEQLSEGGSKQGCGWLEDKFGVSWQIVPAIADDMMNDPDPERSQRVVDAILNMDKLDISTLQQAYDGTNHRGEGSGSMISGIGG